MTGEQLKRWRQSKSLSRKQLGDEFGVSEHTVAKWEQGVNPIPRAVSRLVTQPPQLSFTLEEFGKLQEKARSSGKSIEQVCLDLIKAGLMVLLLSFLAFHLVRSPKIWTAAALKQTAKVAVAKVKTMLPK